MNARPNIVFVDTAVANYSTLRNDLDPAAEVILISGRNAVQQMAVAVLGFN